MNKPALAVSALALAVSQAATAGTETWFTPLTESTTVMAPNDVNELTSPWILPPELKATNLMSMREAESNIGESIVRATDAGNVASMIDMIWFDNHAENIFLPHETPWGAGVSRYNVKRDVTEVLFAGNEGGRDGDWSNDFGAFDPSRVSPNGTVWAAEEWAGTGRVVEILDPYVKAPKDPVVGNGEVDSNIRVLTAFPLTAQEGIGFSNWWPNKVVYFIDENRSGSIYKIVWNKPGDYTSGQTFVLVVDDFDGDVTKNYNDDANVGKSRVGAAHWVAMTDKYGKVVDAVTNDPFTEPFGGRQAADDLGGTPYGRPEDTEVGKLANGNEVLYFTATSENAVYSVEMTSASKAIVRLFASEDATAKNAGYPATTASLNSPDNLAQDALGNIYIIEDSPNTTTVGANGGDVWFARDLDNDGVAESIDHMMSLGVNQSEATGMVFNPVKLNEYAIAVQHPASTNLANVPEGFGDAVWNVEIKWTEKSADFLQQLRKASYRKHHGGWGYGGHYYNYDRWYNEYKWDWNRGDWKYGK